MNFVNATHINTPFCDDQGGGGWLEVTPLPTPTSERGRREWKTKEEGEFLMFQVHVAGPGKDRHQLHGVFGTGLQSGGPPGFESQLCHNKQHTLQQIIQCPVGLPNCLMYFD